MTSENENENKNSERDWLAFRYIAGELTAEEVLAFEDRMAVDLEDCEAVSRAVELAQLTAIAHDHAAELVEVSGQVASLGTGFGGTGFGGTWTRRMAWMACGAAACLLCVVFARQSDSNSLDGSPVASVWGPRASGPRTSGVESPELALAWAVARSESLIPAADLGEAHSQAGSGDLNGDDDQFAAPSWMLVAVAGMTAGVEQVE